MLIHRQGPIVNDLKILLVIPGIALVILSVFVFGIAILGFRGELADVNVAENRQIEFQLVALGATLLLLGCWIVRRGTRASLSEK